MTPRTDFRLDEPKRFDGLQAEAGKAGGVPTDNESTGADPAENLDDEQNPHTERQLDKGLKETFPASDPVSINPGAD